MSVWVIAERRKCAKQFLLYFVITESRKKLMMETHCRRIRIGTFAKLCLITHKCYAYNIMWTWNLSFIFKRTKSSSRLDVARNGHYSIMFKLKIHKMIKTNYLLRSMELSCFLAAAITYSRTRRKSTAIGNGVTKTGLRLNLHCKQIHNQVKRNYTKCH